MAPGYVIAACLEGSGAIGFALALCRLHAEQRARAAELARFLRSGQIPDAPPQKVRFAAITRAAPPIPLTPATPSAGPLDRSDALVALRSAYGASMH